MFKFLFVIFAFFVLLLLLMGFSLFRFLKNIFSPGTNAGRRTNSRQWNQNEQTQNQKTQQNQTNSQAQRKKIISKDEGEYVDYEEVDDSK